MLSLLLPCLACPAADLLTGSSFDAANKLYEQGKYSDAASAYEQLAAGGQVSPALLFNLGNACFKSGQIGRAIAAFRASKALAPRDPDVRANLQFARNQVEPPTRRASRWQGWLGTLTLNEWTTLSAAALWLDFLLLALGQCVPAWKRRLRTYVLLTLGLTAVVGVCLALTLTHHIKDRTAIVVAREAVARSGPFDESQSAFTAHDGAEFDVLDAKNDWFQVSDGGRNIGWLKRDAVRLATP